MLSINRSESNLTNAFSFLFTSLTISTLHSSTVYRLFSYQFTLYSQKHKNHRKTAKTFGCWNKENAFKIIKKKSFKKPKKKRFFFNFWIENDNICCCGLNSAISMLLKRPINIHWGRKAFRDFFKLISLAFFFQIRSRKN